MAAEPVKVSDEKHPTNSTHSIPKPHQHSSCPALPLDHTQHPQQREKRGQKRGGRKRGRARREGNERQEESFTKHPSQSRDHPQAETRRGNHGNSNEWVAEGERRFEWLE